MSNAINPPPDRRTVSDRVDEAVIDMLTHDLGRERQMSAHPPSRTTLEKQPAFWTFERLDTSRADGVQAPGLRPGTTDLRDLAEDFGDDGPTRFYLDLCRQFETVPPEPPWTGCVFL